MGETNHKAEAAELEDQVNDLLRKAAEPGCPRPTREANLAAAQVKAQLVVSHRLAALTEDVEWLTGELGRRLR
jgi:hypothetical protein